MSQASRFWQLIPILYRRRDEAQANQLKQVITLMEEEFLRVEKLTDLAYSNYFIETCSPEILPYIAQLLGIKDLPTTSVLLIRQRACIANTIQYRCRKGLASIAERMVTHITDWPAKLVEYPQQLSMTQSILGPRLNRGKTANITDNDAMELLATPFNITAHTAQISESSSPPINLGRVCLYCWRWRSYPISKGRAGLAEGKSTAEGCYTFDPRGLDTLLFNNPDPNDDLTQVNTEINLPVPIRQHALLQALASSNFQHYYGPNACIYIVKLYQGDMNKIRQEPVAAEKLLPAELKDWNLLPVNSDNKVIIDVKRGRIKLPSEKNMPVGLEVNYHYASPGLLGGGHYDRHSTLTFPEASDEFIVIKETETFVLAQIIDKYVNHPGGAIRTVIQIETNSSYLLNFSSLTIATDNHLIIQASNHYRPCIQFQNNNLQIKAISKCAITFTGLMIIGCLELQGAIQLNLLHCTSWLPNAKTVINAQIKNTVDAQTLNLNLQNCIFGKIILPKSKTCELSIQDSIIDAAGDVAIAGDIKGLVPAAKCSLQRVTIFGSIYVNELALATDSIITQPVKVDHIEQGCMRYCSLPIGSKTPPRYRCQPETDFIESTQIPPNEFSLDQKLILAQLQPRFISTQFLTPGYAQLSMECHQAITYGAEDGAEMGAFHLLQRVQLQEHLPSVLAEYLPYDFQVNYRFSG
jgi:hypothetical protein